MKKTILILTTAVATLLAACNSAGNSSEKATADSATATVADTTTSLAGTLYTCPMHAEVTSDKPGKCPKCKMDLVVKESSADTTAK